MTVADRRPEGDAVGLAEASRRWGIRRAWGWHLPAVCAAVMAIGVLNGCAAKKVPCDEQPAEVRLLDEREVILREVDLSTDAVANLSVVSCTSAPARVILSPSTENACEDVELVLEILAEDDSFISLGCYRYSGATKTLEFKGACEKLAFIYPAQFSGWEEKEIEAQTFGGNSRWTYRAKAISRRTPLSSRASFRMKSGVRYDLRLSLNTPSPPTRSAKFQVRIVRDL